MRSFAAKLGVILLLLALFKATMQDRNFTSRRTKRHLVYPMGGLFKAVLALAIPIKIGLKQSLVAGVNIQFQYQAPQDLSKFEAGYPPTISKSRERRGIIPRSVSDEKVHGSLQNGTRNNRNKTNQRNFQNEDKLRNEGATSQSDRGLLYSALEGTLNRVNSAYVMWILLLLQSAETTGRTKRHIVYPMGGTFKLVVAIAIPIKLGIKQSLACGVNFQFQYAEPTNITQLEVPYPPIVARKKRHVFARDERVLFYLAVESSVNRAGANGKACVLRSICDNAMHPLHHRANGLYGELLHIAFTPTYGDDKDLDLVYVEAQRAGEFGVDCLSLYPDCPRGTSIMDLLTVLDN